MLLGFKTVQQRTLRPSTVGNWLTDGKTYKRFVELEVDEPISNWREVTQGEYDKAQTEAKEKEQLEYTE